MPPNTSANPPSEEPTGTTQLPLSRVKRLIALDPDIASCSNPAAFLITLSTELFIQHLAASAHSVVRAERKPRKNIQYKDLAAAVARMDNLEFLSDVVPQTVPFREVKAKRARENRGEAAKEKGQMKLAMGGGNAFEAVMAHDGETVNGAGEEDEDADPERQLQMESRGARTSLGSSRGRVNGKADRDGDVEMS